MALYEFVVYAYILSVVGAGFILSCRIDRVIQLHANKKLASGKVRDTKHENIEAYIGIIIVAFSPLVNTFIAVIWIIEAMFIKHEGKSK